MTTVSVSPAASRRAFIAASGGATLAPAAAALQTRFGEQARAYREAGRTEGTRRVHESAFTVFKAWCEQHQASSLPADPRTVAFYLTNVADRYRATTLDLHLAAIAYVHRAAGVPVPTTHQAVREVRIGVRRTHGTAARGKAALMIEDLRRLVALAARLRRRLPPRRAGWARCRGPGIHAARHPRRAAPFQDRPGG